MPKKTADGRTVLTLTDRYPTIIFFISVIFILATMAGGVWMLKHENYLDGYERGVQDTMHEHGIEPAEEEPVTE